MSNIAVFLDRDGTIAPDVNYCRKAEDFNLFPVAPKAIKLLNNKGLKVVIITNQSGIARDYFDEANLAQIHRKLEDELAKQGAYIDAIYYCPHHPDEGCDCRKPKTALFQQAAKALDINFNNSFMIGDMQIDVDAGRSVGCQTVLVTTGPKGGKDITDAADYTASNLLEAVQWIIDRIDIHLLTLI